MDRFDQIKLGDEAEFSHVITAGDVDTFVRLTGDNNPLHTDEEFARRTSFRQRVVHGMLTASFVSTIVGVKLIGAGALWFEQTFQFLGPVRIGEKIRIWGRVKQKSVAQRIVVIEVAVHGDGDRMVMTGEGKVKVLEINAAESNVAEAAKKSPLLSPDMERDMGSVEMAAIKATQAPRPVHPGTSKADKNKGTVIVTGGGRGIGAAIAKELGRSGFNIVVNYLNNSKTADEVVQAIQSLGGQAAAFQADVRDIQSVQKMTEFARQKFGNLYGVVNNATGVIENKSLSELKWPDIQAQMDIHLKSSFFVCQEILPDLAAQHRGAIVNIASIYTDNVPPPKMAAYCAAKTALVALTKAMALEYGPAGIRVNCVSPGMTETDLISNIPEKTKMIAKMQTPLRRLATPEDVAATVAFLFSDAARHVTGETIRVCGGSVMI